MRARSSITTAIAALVVGMAAVWACATGATSADDAGVDGGMPSSSSGSSGSASSASGGSSHASSARSTGSSPQATTSSGTPSVTAGSSATSGSATSAASSSSSLASSASATSMPSSSSVQSSSVMMSSASSSSATVAMFGDGGLTATCTQDTECASRVCEGGYCQKQSACSKDSDCGIGPNGQNVCLNVRLATPTVGVCHPSCYGAGQANCPEGQLCCSGSDVPNRSLVSACTTTCTDL